MTDVKLTSTELSLFCYQLYVVVKSGLPLTESMDMIRAEVNNKLLDKVVEELSENITQGEWISDTLKKYPIFPEYFVAMTEIAEKTGNLETQLLSLSRYYENRARQEKRISNAVTYPIILLGMMAIVIVFLVTRVIPMFSKVLNSLGMTIPATTQNILSVGLFLKNYGILLLIAIFFIIFLFIRWIRSPKGRVSFDHWKLRMPFTKSLAQKILTANFADGMNMMIHSGMTPAQSLPMIKGALGNAYAEFKMDQVIQTAETENLSDLLRKAELFPELFQRMVILGEKSGELESGMEKAAEIYKNDAEKHIDRWASSLEPVLVIILSGIIGIILLSVMIPLINIISEIG